MVAGGHGGTDLYGYVTSNGDIYLWGGGVYLGQGSSSSANYSVPQLVTNMGSLGRSYYAKKNCHRFESHLGAYDQRRRLCVWFQQQWADRISRTVYVD